MTLATLKGMNFNLGDIASAFQPKAADASASGVHQAAAAAKPAPAATDGDAPAGAAMVDPMELWGALTTQFQQIAATALQEVSTQAAASMAKGAADAATPKPAAKKAPAKKPAAKTANK